MTITEARAAMERRDLSVVYKARGPEYEPEHGQITNVNDHYVFVRFEGSETSRATDPADLELLARKGRDG
jgi:hypothetical protein